MRISVVISIAFLAACANAAKNKTSAASEARGKRDLDIDFGAPAFYQRPPATISKRISTGYQNYPTQDFYTVNNKRYTGQPVFDPLHYNGAADDYVRDFDSHGTNYISDQHFHQPGHHYQQQQHQQQPQYLEAPEPIIEIIIKESNETLPGQEELLVQATPQKKKKEEVQVFYVKYKKDEHNGVVIEDPVAALSPPSYHQENDDADEESDGYNDEPLPEAQAYQGVTEAPVQRPTTTLRTIIHPDSERFHSNSGIQVTFNSEDKRQASQHQYQEHIEASALQPIVAEPQQLAPPQRQQFQHQQQSQFNSQQFNQQFQFNQQNRFEGRKPAPVPQSPPHNFGPPPPQFHQAQLPVHQELPRPQFSSQPFRDVAPHHPPQPPPNRYFDQQQQFQQNQRPNYVQGPPPPPQHHQPPPQQQPHQPPKHRGPPQSQQPIPIPLFNVQQQQLPKLNRPQTFYHQQQQQPHQPQQQQQPQFNGPPPQKSEFQTRPPPQSTLSQYRVRQQQSQPQTPPTPQQQHYQHQQQQQQQHFSQQSQFSQQNIQGGGLVVQNAPNLGGPQPNQKLNPVGAEFVNKVITGAELVASVPKFEQHITQTVPFGQPIRPYDLPSDQPHQQPQQQPQQYQQPQQQTQQQHHRFQQQQQETQFISNQQHFSQPQTVIRPEPTPRPVEQFSASFNTERFVPQHQQQSAPKQAQSQQPKQQHHYPTNVQPGHSVSTLASDVLPALVSQQNQKQQLQFTDSGARHRPTYASSEFVPSLEERRPAVKPQSAARITTTTTTTTTVRPTAAATSKKPSRAQLELPDEVPDDLRAQLLSSGILDNADISVLDYDKVGDVPLESLPPEHLANFYGGGGAAQIAGSNKVVTVVKPNGDTVHRKQVSAKSVDSKPAHIVQAISVGSPAPSATTTTEKPVTLPAHRQNVDLKVVRFDSHSQKSVTDQYIRPDSTVLPSVELSEQDQQDQQQYNRYLPLKVSGAQFPVPDVPELRGRRITSVVVLAPVDQAHQSGLAEAESPASAEGRFERDLVDTRQIRFVAGDSLKQLLKKPTRENFKRWLEREAKTELDLQSVVLLVTQNDQDEPDAEKEIYMYDIGTEHANRLSGELSSAFVNVAEENAQAQDIDSSAISDSGIVQQMEAQRRSDDADVNDAAEEFDSVGVHSEQVPAVVSLVLPSRSEAGGVAKQQVRNQVQITSGYSVIS